MEALICVAGKATRMRKVLEDQNVTAKCLVKVGGRSLLRHAIREVEKYSPKRITVVASPEALTPVREEATCASVPIRVLPQEDYGFTGTTAAVLSGLAGVEESCLITWSDMLFALPDEDPRWWARNIAFVSGMSQAYSQRFDAVTCSGEQLVAFSPRSVPRQGPFLATTGVYHLVHVAEFRDIAMEMKAMFAGRELPVEAVFQKMLPACPFFVDAILRFIDVGTTEAYYAVSELLTGDPSHP